jgi:hypothetical protein
MFSIDCIVVLIERGFLSDRVPPVCVPLRPQSSLFSLSHPNHEYHSASGRRFIRRRSLFTGRMGRNRAFACHYSLVFRRARRGRSSPSYEDNAGNQSLGATVRRKLRHDRPKTPKTNLVSYSYLRVWIKNMMSGNNQLLVVQTIRNGIMTSTYFATSASTIALYVLAYGMPHNCASSFNLRKLAFFGFEEVENRNLPCLFSCVVFEEIISH